MSYDKVYVDGELYLTIETVAEIYRVEAVWLHEVVDSGLIGAGVGPLAATCIPAVRMDRVATIVRLHRTLGLDVDAIRLALENAASPR